MYRKDSSEQKTRKITFQLFHQKTTTEKCISSIWFWTYKSTYACVKNVDPFVSENNENNL